MPSARRLTATSVFGIVTLAAIAVLACLVLIAPPDGNERAQLMQFFGRFHPLSVHLPIALLMLVPLLELAGRTPRFAYLLPASSFVLGAAMVGSIGAAGLGWCLARSGGYAGPLVTQHMWAAVMTAAGAWICWTLRLHTDSLHAPKIYAITLLATLAVTSYTGYRGGQLSQGENHLTEYMPAPLAALLGVSNPVDIPANSPNGGPQTFYGARIHPIFAQHCISCHGRNKHKANLRLDSFEAAMRGGKHGPAIRAGDVKASELFRRITLAPSDDDFMPPQRRPLSASDVKTIEQWIAAGASGSLPRDAIPDTVMPRAAAEVTMEDVNPEAVARQRAGLATAVAQLRQRLPNVVEYQSRSSADIVVNAAWMQSKFGDEELAALAPLAEQIVIADFSNTAITDKSAIRIAAMKHLRVLGLRHTRISDATLQSFGSLQQLESLSLFETAVTSGGLAAVAQLPKLKRVYVSGTKISHNPQVPQELKHKLVF